MQLVSLRLGALSLAGAALLAAALPTTHAAAPTTDDPAISSGRGAEQEECGFGFRYLQSLLQDKLTMPHWLGQAHEDRKCLQEVADTGSGRGRLDPRRIGARRSPDPGALPTRAPEPAIFLTLDAPRLGGRPQCGEM